MRLIRIDISGYKHLKSISVPFQTTEGDLFRGDIPIRFFIGLNGSGKSVFLEAICFLFSCLAEDESPGLAFSLEYEIQRRGVLYRVHVSSSSGPEKFDIRVSTGTPGQEEVLHSFAARRELLPDYVFTCASGSNNNFFEIVVRSPREALYRELFHVSMLGKSALSDRQRREAADRLLASLRQVEENPLCLFIDEQTSILALGAFLSVFPAGTDAGEADACARCRRHIFNTLSSRPRPVSFSLVLDEERLASLGSAAAGCGPLFAGLEDADTPRACAWDTLRAGGEALPDPAQGDRVLTFLFAPYGDPDSGVFWVESLTRAYPSPIDLLSKLLLARHQGIIKEAHMTFQIQGSDELVEENALSEGEYMLLVRLGLLAIGRSAGCQCLYLFDEPDVYLNERWNVDFVSMIHQIFEGTTPLHEIIVATHSSLILTDAFPEQLYYFQLKDGHAQCFNVRASTFGGSRNEIMQSLFQTNHSVGSFAYHKVVSLLESSEDADELESYLESIGSGYLRLRLLDKIQRLREEER